MLAEINWALQMAPLFPGPYFHHLSPWMIELQPELARPYPGLSAPIAKYLELLCPLETHSPGRLARRSIMTLPVMIMPSHRRPIVMSCMSDGQSACSSLAMFSSIAPAMRFGSAVPLGA